MGTLFFGLTIAYGVAIGGFIVTSDTATFAEIQTALHEESSGAASTFDTLTSLDKDTQKLVRFLDELE